VQKLCKAVQKFSTYIERNGGFIPNYGERCRNGEGVSTGFVESTVNYVQELCSRSDPLQGWQCKLSALEDEAPLKLPPSASLIKPCTFHNHIRHQA
jgi:hypothetical protein